ncbi:MAG: hypothetical protein M8467_19630, partial [Anaerolineae bacterium]|nr:hypothetical protein [Anaerolineae bacterium]
IARSLQDLGLDEAAAWWAAGTVKILINHQQWWAVDGEGERAAYQVLTSWLRDSEVQQFMQVNRHRGVLWFNHEAFGKLLGWMLTIAAVEISADPGRTPDEVAEQIMACYELIEVLQEAEKASEYQVVELMEAVKGQPVQARAADLPGKKKGG